MTMFAETIYLDSYLAPLAPFLARSDITDIYVNRPQEIWIESLGGAVECFDVPELTSLVLTRLTRQIAAMSAQGINREHPLLAAALPDGSRVQIVMPPATRGEIALAIRKHLVVGRTLEDYDRDGAFSGTQIDHHKFDVPAEKPSPVFSADLKETLRMAVRQRLNILISGGTSTGKTTFLNALMREIPLYERLILIEDTPELQLIHRNSVGLLAARSAISEAEITAEDLLVASLRMRPDRIILGEMRSKEALTFLRAVNTGHPGSISSIHADSPERAVDQLALLVLQTGMRMAWDEIVDYVRRSIDLIVQLERDGGRRSIAQIMFL